MAYDSIISRTNAQALVPEQVSTDLLTAINSESAALALFRKVTMATNQTRMPVLSALPTAYFVSGDTGQKQTTQATWANKYLNVEEIAAIVPIPEAVLDDAGFDVWGSVKPLIVSAIARTLDAAVFFGTNKPSSWGDAIVPAATTAGHVSVRGTTTQANGGLAGDLSAAFGFVETDGFDVNGIVANTTYKGLLRTARDTTGQLLIDLNGNIWGIAPQYPMRGLWGTGASATEAIVGDFTQGIIGVRQDITYKVLTEATLQDASGNTTYNLAQQDMVALRVVARYAFQVANTINYDNPTESTRYPWAIMNAPAS